MTDVKSQHRISEHKFEPNSLRIDENNMPGRLIKYRSFRICSCFILNKQQQKKMHTGNRSGDLTSLAAAVAAAAVEGSRSTTARKVLGARASLVATVAAAVAVSEVAAAVSEAAQTSLVDTEDAATMAVARTVEPSTVAVARDSRITTFK